MNGIAVTGDSTVFTEIKIGLQGGRYFRILPTGPDVVDVTIEDIARGTSRQPRFAGQTPEPYSVARHSITLADWLAHDFPDEAKPLRARAIIHDATEALGVSDINRFVKINFGAEIKHLERQIEIRLHEKFGIAHDPSLDQLVTLYDQYLGAHESRHFGWPVPYQEQVSEFPFEKLNVTSDQQKDYLEFLAVWEATR